MVQIDREAELAGPIHNKGLFTLVGYLGGQYAEDTPLSCFRILQILYEAGLPEEWCQAFVPSELEVATQLVADPRVSFLSFIGSAKVGWMLRSKLAPGTRCAPRRTHGAIAVTGLRLAGRPAAVRWSQISIQPDRQHAPVHITLTKLKVPVIMSSSFA